MNALQSELLRWLTPQLSEDDAVLAKALPLAEGCPALCDLLRSAAIQWPGLASTSSNGQRQQLAMWLLLQLPELDADQTLIANRFFSALLENQCTLEARTDGDNWPELLPLGRSQLRTSPLVPSQNDASAEDQTPTKGAPGPSRPSLREHQLFSVELLAELESATTPDVRRSCILRLTDELCQLANKKPTPDLTALNAALFALRSLADDEQAQIIPTDWSFASQLAAEPFETDLGQTAYRFDQLIPPGQVIKVHRLGWLGPVREVNRTAQAIISAGPTVEAIQNCDKALDSVHLDAVEPLKQQVKGWTRQLRFGKLDETLKDFFRTLYSDEFQSWRDLDDGSFAVVQENVLILLEDRLGYQAFFPKRRGEYRDNYVLSVGSKPSRTGRVCRVIQPGLMDRQGRLILPARVEEE